MKKIALVCMLIASFFSVAEQTDKAEPRIVNVQVDIAPSLLPEDAQDWILYVYAAKPNTRLPLANYKGKLSELPARIELNESMYLLPHLTLKQAEEVVIIAKTTKSENPHQKSRDDFIGYSQKISFVDGEQLNVAVTIDQRDKHKPAK